MSPSPRTFVSLDSMSTPVGTVLIAWDRSGRLRALDWHDAEARMGP